MGASTAHLQPLPQARAGVGRAQRGETWVSGGRRPRFFAAELPCNASVPLQPQSSSAKCAAPFHNDFPRPCL
eukprot:4429768-Prymnesium_polylepis.1